MAVNYCGIFITQKESIISTAISNTVVIYHGISTQEKVGTAVNYCGIFITLTPEVCLINIKLMLFSRKHASLLPLKQGLPQVNKFYCQGLKKVANSGKKFSDFHVKVQGAILKTINELLFKLKK